jgi:hypothetical protein
MTAPPLREGRRGTAEAAMPVSGYGAATVNAGSP